MLSVLEHEECDDRLVNEVHGFISRCSAQSGAHTTDYVVSRGTAVLIAGHSRVDVMIAVAIFAGYMTEIDIDGRTAYKLVDDDPDFLHLRLKAEVDWEKQRKSDNSNPALIVPVRIRDGDACRWCGDVVNWQSRTGGRNGTYDHLEPGQPATIDTYVVACGSCNSSRGDGTKAAGQRQLLPPPSVPYFSQYTSEWIRDNKWAQNNGYEPPAASRKKIRPGTPAPHITAATTRQSSATTASTAPAGERPDNQSETAGTPDLTDAPAQRTDTKSANATSNTRTDSQSANAPEPESTSADTAPDRTPQNPIGQKPANSVATGRDGAGRDGSGRVGNQALDRHPATQSSSPRKASRGRRRRKRGHTNESQNRSSGDPRG
ncbi:hypothetical protein ACFVWF_32830 [Rhodococcus qingshengii]|uniref:hypothetical protein n=1 Tax=Rhodococcus qingshengii TaxID=334542 RepID=UPI0036DE76B6